MSEELKLNLDDAVEDVKKRFDAMESNRKALISRRSEIDKQLQEIGIEQIRLQGENKALMALMGKGPEGKLLKTPEEPKLIIPSKKGEKNKGNT